MSGCENFASKEKTKLFALELTPKVSFGRDDRCRRGLDGGLKAGNALVKLSDKHFARAVKVFLFFTAGLLEPCLALCAGARGSQGGALNPTTPTKAGTPSKGIIVVGFQDCQASDTAHQWLLQ